MKKQTTSKLPTRLSKRRRRRQLEKAKHWEKPLFDYASRAEGFAARLVLPGLFAHIARQLSGRAIQPADFYCGCDPSFKDGLPLCERKQTYCRFVHRAGKRPIEDPRHVARYQALWESALCGYRGPALKINRTRNNE